MCQYALRARQMWRAGWRKEQFYRSSEVRARLKLFSQTVRHIWKKSTHSGGSFCLLFPAEGKK